jgi:lantibiotic modifying enzyme
MNRKNTDEKKILIRIANHLIINASFLSDIGLYHGKMGIVLFFVHYSRYTGETAYDDFAGVLMDEITEEIHAGVPVHFESGLSGIGWGITYLIQNGFMEGDPGQILSDVDQKVMEQNLSRMTDSGVRTGLKGISCYLEKRIGKPSKRGKTFDDAFLNDYVHAKQKFNITVPDDREILSAIYKKTPKGDDITQWRLGLENGSAGYGLKIILK